MKREMKGITLISLAITVVVLIILAGVSISTILGDDGIIKQSTLVAERTNEKLAKEEIKKLVAEYDLTGKTQTLEEYLKTKIPNRIDSVINNGDGTLNVSKNGCTVTVENRKSSSGGTSAGDNTGGNTEGETQTPEITVSGIKVVADNTGTGSAITEADSVYLGNTLYITFIHSITGGTTTVKPDIPYAVTKNGTYTFMVTGTVNGKSYTKNVSVTVNQFKNVYKLTYPDGIVYMPGDFKIADDSASTIQGGVVIEDKDGNQFVWGPVATIADYKRRAYSTNVGTEEIDTTTNSIKINFSSSYSMYFTEALPEDEKNSVTTYKGFYIGRYEAGDKESTEAKILRGSKDVTKTVTIKKGQAPYNHVTRTQAKSLAEGFKTQQNYSQNIKTKLVSSYAWDTTIEFIQKVNSDYGNSEEEGNYNKTTFLYTDLTGVSQTKESGSSVLVPTGQTTPVCNIYDMGGNLYEWTTESCSNLLSYTFRGGSYHYSDPVGGRNSLEDDSFYFIGFRITLFM